MPILVHQFPYNTDNYGALVHDTATGQTACIDAGAADPIFEALAHKGWTLDQLWITHHHWDHTDALEEVKVNTCCDVIGPKYEGSDKLSLDQRVGDGDAFSLGDTRVSCLHTPGHTLDMINYHVADDGVIFTGDTLFSLGCGRVFEGTKPQMQASMARLRALPDNTLVYGGHEYTTANAAFALSVDPDNATLQARAKEVARQRDQGQPTQPVRLGDEKATNPFLRYDDPDIKARLGMEGASDADVFTEIRNRKDAF